MNYTSELKRSGLDFESPILGINENQIREVAEMQNVSSLPCEYVEFLRHCGGSAGLFSRDSLYFYPAICDLKEI